MQQRVLNHEMRNQAAKLTPLERAEKRWRKLQEDTSRQVHVAVFAVGDLSSGKHRFKVDVNAQQHYLSGTVLLNQEGSPGAFTLVVVEGGPKGIRKFVKLMMKRLVEIDFECLRSMCRLPCLCCTVQCRHSPFMTHVAAPHAMGLGHLACASSNGRCALLCEV